MSQSRVEQLVIVSTVLVSWMLFGGAALWVGIWHL